ncbi:MAG: hypothetical protein M3P51_05190 [Chloroflexota bacterium]|nr:hypothetical protein [Chloroflexota bacterium]
MSVLDFMNDQESRRGRLIASGVTALRSKCSSEPGPWKAQELLDFLTVEQHLPERFARKAIWRLTGDGTLHFVDDFSNIAKH